MTLGNGWQRPIFPIERLHFDVRFLHVIPDDKFIDEAKAIFEEAMPGAHDFVLLSRPEPLRYIRTFEPTRIDLDKKPQHGFLSNMPSYTAVFIHFLNAKARELIDKAPPGTHFVWIGWGGDYYHLTQRADRLLLPETRKWLKSTATRGSPTVELVRKALAEIGQMASQPRHVLQRVHFLWRMRQIGPRGPDEEQVVNRFSLFAPVLREEYESVTMANPGFRPKFAEWNYWTAGLDPLRDQPPQPPSASNVLLGNSATPENNHLEAMHLIESAAEGDRKIICPLSYGNLKYGDMVAKTGEEFFGGKFVPLRHYMDTVSYVETLRSCSVVAMNHIRQQAMGNIIMMLWLGARVFLNHESPVNREMASIGIDVYDIRALPEFLQFDGAVTSVDLITDIRERIDRRFGRDAILEKTKRLLVQADEVRRASSGLAGQLEVN